MGKIIFLLAVTLLILPLVSSINIEIEKLSENEAFIYGLKSPATFDVKIINNGGSDNIEFYTLLGLKIFPVGKIPIEAGETKEIQLEVSPIEDINVKGPYTFEYIIRGQDSSEIKKQLTFRIVELKDVFEIGSGEFSPESNSVEIFIKNKVNYNFPEVNVQFSSVFFNLSESFEIGAYEKKNFTIQLNREDFKKLMAGFYTLNAEITVDIQKTKEEGVIKFIEKDIVKTTEKTYGFIIFTKEIQKSNEGNIIADAQIIIKKNIISRLFTDFSPEPDVVTRKGFGIDYAWNRQIKPGEIFVVNVKTNWLWPLILIFFIILIVILAKQYTKTNLVLKKRVNFVRAKGGEFALKVSVFVGSKKHIEKVNVIDRLPILTKLYEKFGVERPTKIDEKNRKIEWYFEKLEAGETRVLSYIIYSKVGVLGKFALPLTSAVYEKDGKVHETQSNRTFFVSEQIKKEIEE